MSTTTSYSPSQAWNGSQLNSSSNAATRYGVPLNIVRGVTGYKYGQSATAADFDYVAAQLDDWYRTYAPRTSDALTAWQEAAAAEMPGASSLEVAIATATQSVTQTGETTVGGAVDLADAFGGIATDLEGATSGLTDETGFGEDAPTAKPGGPDTTTAPTTGTGSDAAAAASGASLGSYASKALSNLSNLAKAGGLAALLVDPSFLWRMVKIVGGLALAYVGIRQLATVGAGK